MCLSFLPFAPAVLASITLIVSMRLNSRGNHSSLCFQRICRVGPKAVFSAPTAKQHKEQLISVSPGYSWLQWWSILCGWSLELLPCAVSLTNLQTLSYLTSRIIAMIPGHIIHCMVYWGYISSSLCRCWCSPCGIRTTHTKFVMIFSWLVSELSVPWYKLICSIETPGFCSR